MRVIRNLGGRTIFLALSAFSLIFAALASINTGIVDAAYRWLPALLAVSSGVTFILLLVINLSQTIYKLRLVNVTLIMFLGLATIVTGYAIYRQPFYEGKTFAIITAFAQALYLVCMALLLLPDAHSDLAHRMHPFVAEPYLGDITLKATHQQRPGGHRAGRKRIKHREISIFEDWPAPVPFAARALYSFKTDSSSELAFNKGEQLIILDCRGNWWQARHPHNGTVGFVPSNYIQVLQKAQVIADYSGQNEDEASVIRGETIEVMEIHDQMCLVRSVSGKIGSVPTKNLQIHPIALPNYEEGDDENTPGE